MGKAFTRDCKTVESGTLNLNNLKAENIKKGVTIGGVTGSLIPGVGDGNFHYFSSGYTQTEGSHSGYKKFTYTRCPFYPHTLLLMMMWTYYGTSYLACETMTQSRKYGWKWSEINNSRYHFARYYPHTGYSGESYVYDIQSGSGYYNFNFLSNGFSIEINRDVSMSLQGFLLG